MNILRKCIIFLCLLAANFPACANEENAEFVSYEKFGAKGDGKHDDQLAIAAAHDFANSAKLPVKVKNNATYYIGGGSRVINIMTDTDFGKAQFIIDDRRVKNRKKPVFAVKSRLKSYSLKDLTSLYKHQTKLPVLLKEKSLIQLNNGKIKRFIRYGVNANKGANQNDIIIVNKDGSIDKSTPLVWDFEEITSNTVRPIDTKQLKIRGGIFTTIANAEPGAHQYYARNMQITRSNVLVSGLVHKVIEPEAAHSFPYSGFITISGCCNVTVQDCVFTGRKVYKTVKPNSRSTSTGTYDISLNRAVNIKFINCSQTNDIFDTQYWGIMGSNFCKNLEYDRCRLSRFDAHCGVYNATIRNSALRTISVTGYGKLLVEKSTVYGRYFITLRQDYGSFWRGDVIIRNCTFIPSPGRKISNTAIIGGYHNDHHNFGYICSLPANIFIDGLDVRDGNHAKNYKGVNVFSVFNSNYIKNKKYKELYPITKPKQVVSKKFTCASGKYLSLSSNKAMFRGVKFSDEARKKRAKEYSQQQKNAKKR